jgi:uncharacterized surface protein with fasciclin (FAS1) repeats
VFAATQCKGLPKPNFAIAVLAVPAAASPASSKNIVETAAGAPQFSTLVSLVNNARVITADLRASNGIVHAISRVLIPPSLR